MPREFKLPDLGEGIHEGEIVEVLVSVGDAVEDGQPILVVETDKANTEVPSPVTGVVKEIRVHPGDVVKVGDVLMTFSVEGEAEATEPAPVPRKEEAAAPGAAAAAEKQVQPEVGAKRKTEAMTQEPVAAAEASAPRERAGPIAAAPSTRRLARELGVALEQVEATGPGGRVTAEDVRGHAQKALKPRPAVGETVAAPSVISSLPAAVPPLPDFAQWGPVERVPLRSVRRTTARNMALAWSQIPHVTHEDVADITELEAFRRRHKKEIEDAGGALSLTVFALKAAVAGLKAHPRFNSSLDTESEEIILKRHYHIGVAVDTDRGLLVPAIRDVDRKSLTQLAVELHDLTQRTRDGKVNREEMIGGTFTITNIGPLGGTGFTPIINYPQVAILGLAMARMQPVVIGDSESFKIVPRLLLPLVLGFDHRVLDGADAARFLRIVAEALENPEHLLMML